MTSRGRVSRGTRRERLARGSWAGVYATGEAQLRLTRRADPAAGLEQYIHRLGTIIPVVEPHAPVRQLSDGSWSGTEGAGPSGGQHHGVARSTEAAIEHELVTLEPVAHGRGIGLRDAQPQRLTSLYGCEWNHHHPCCWCHRFPGVDLRGSELGAAHLARRQLLAGVEDGGGGVTRDAACTHDVGIAVHAGPRLGVVVIERERVGFRRLQEVDDLAVLVSALRQPLLLGLADERGFPAAPGAGRSWQRCSAS